jgi:hypothetical protein
VEGRQCNTDEGDSVTYVVCLACGLMSLYPLPSPASFEESYHGADCGSKETTEVLAGAGLLLRYTGIKV